jgi:hypothetical protein
VTVSLGVIFALVLWTNPVRYFILFIGIFACIWSFLKPQAGVIWLLGILPYIGFFKRIEYYFTGDVSAEYNNIVSLIPEMLILTLAIAAFVDTKRNNNILLLKNPLPVVILFFIFICFIQIFNQKSTVTFGLYGFISF